MSHDFVDDPRFLAFLLAADRDLAQEAREGGCPACGGKLHAASYRRRPRGVAVSAEWVVRFSFCCAAEGCRKRCTPGSVRFLGRKVYAAAVVVLASILYHGLTPARRDRCVASFGVSERTLVRWRQWWIRDFAGSRFWRSVRGLFASAIVPGSLPVSLFERFDGDEEGRLVRMLRFLLPITGGKGLAVLVF